VCVEGRKFGGKTLTFHLSETDEGATLVSLTDGEWPADDPDSVLQYRWASAVAAQGVRRVQLVPESLIRVQ